MASMRWLTVLSVLVFLAGCSGGDQVAGGGAADSAGAQGRPDSMAQNARPQRPPVPVAVAAAEVGPIASYYRATASLEAEKQADVLARVEGVVTAVVAEEGDVVAEGDVLLRIEDRQYRYRVEQAQARTAQLRAAFERLEEMRKEQLATDAEFETARADLASAEADEGLARLELSYAHVTAPVSGVVTQRLVDEGQNLTAGTPVYTLVDVHPLLARVHVPSREFRALEVDQQVELVLDSTGQRLAGRIKLISPVIDPASGTIKVTVEVPEYPAGTRPGDFAEVRIVTELRPDALLVPRTAVVTEKGEAAVFVVVEGESVTAERRLVEVGFTDDDRAQLLSGVTVGERVVVKGQRSLKHGQNVRVLDGPGAEPATADSAGRGGRGGAKRGA
jgi:membrane fusion protein (multidrug efflux system)